MLLALTAVSEACNVHKDRKVVNHMTAGEIESNQSQSSAGSASCSFILRMVPYRVGHSS